LNIRTGAFVWTNFPFGPPHQPDSPGPTPHIAYCVGVRQVGTRQELVLAYTSSGRWRGSTDSVPLGVIEFDDSAAARLNQRAFHLDLRVLARVTPRLEWFPRFGAPDQGIVAWADRVLRDQIEKAMINLARRRPEVVQIRGVGSRPRPQT
jgi:hypothetical protein